MIIKLKLPEKSVIPERLYPTRKEMTDIGYAHGRNNTIDEVVSMNPPLEMDVKAMMEVISEHHSGNVQEAWFICQDLIANSHKWIKEKLK